VSEFLNIEVEQKIGDLSIQVACSLSAPVTLLFGPSGAGKTSLLRMIAGLSRPDRGHVVLRGRTLVETERGTWVQPGDRSIGFVPQRPVLFPHLTVAENVSFGLSHLDREERGQRTARMLELFHASRLIGRMPASLSGGEKQRIALARALAPGPFFLLMDEPFSGMDVDLQTSLFAELTGWLAEEKVPALYVSHDVAEAFSGATEVVLMEAGRICGQGPAETVLASRRDQLLKRLRG
jgi:molybdate transport system ATP-binding protein